MEEILNDKEVIKRWFEAFACNVNETIMNEHVYAPYNFMWHIMTWGCIELLEDDEAREEFDSLPRENAIYFTDGYDIKISNLSIVKKPTSKELEIFNEKGEINNHNGDVYITALDYSWCYVRTHELGIGPYFVRKNPKIDNEEERRKLNWIEKNRRNNK